MTAQARRAAVPGEKTATIGFLLVPGFALLSYAAAVEPLRAANGLSGRELFRWWHAGPGDEPVRASNGVAVLPDIRMGDASVTADMLFVCAGGNPAAFGDRAVFGWLRRMARRGVTMGGISGGPYLLARAGLLAGRRCTVHWEHVPAFQEAFPDIDVARSLFEIEGDRITCSGGIAAVDMMTALITREHGPALGAAVADWFLHTQVREGRGPQRMDLSRRSGARDERLLRVLALIEQSLEAPLSREDLAERAGVSLRQLERLFREELGRGLHSYYLDQRLARARQLLRETNLPILEVGLATGFASGSQFTRAFRRQFGRSPAGERLNR
jgi:transcriptional regulator GlxA family with amidase domain